MSTEDYSTWSGLAQYLAQVYDVRSRRGQRYEWSYLLVLLAAALLAGEKTLVGMHHWLRMHETELVKVLRPRRRCLPSLLTLSRVLAKVRVEELEAIVGRYQRELDGACGEAGSIVTQQGEQLVGQALDGKTVRGASAHGELVHLVGLVRHGCGLVYDQVKASAKLHERRAAEVIVRATNCVTQSRRLMPCTPAKSRRNSSSLVVATTYSSSRAISARSTTTSAPSSRFCRRMARGSRSTGNMKLPRLLTAAMVAPNASRWRAPRRSTPTCPSPASHRWSGVLAASRGTAVAKPLSPLSISSPALVATGSR